jgi:hypothetical protein
MQQHYLAAMRERQVGVMLWCVVLPLDAGTNTNTDEFTKNIV